ncbi:MAG TPA: OmpA family protein [Burkholderiales bacterium]|nr:OmpA family protein [Burkholderiales bacterium]
MNSKLVNSKLILAFGAAALLAACASSPEPAPTPAPAPAPAPKQSLPVTPPDAPKPAAAPAAPKRCDATVTFQKDETFAFNRYTLTPAANARLDKDVIGKLATCASVEAVVVEGHADRLGSQQYNQKLSERRADSVKAYLVAKGTARDRIETIGMGKTVPATFCPDSKDRKALIACLAPSRRAIISIKGPAR